MAGDWRDDPAFLRDEAIRQAALATGAMREADALREQLEALREAVRAYLNGAPLDEHGRFRDPAREVLYRAAGGQ